MLPPLKTSQIFRSTTPAPSRSATDRAHPRGPRRLLRARHRRRRRRDVRRAGCSGSRRSSGFTPSCRARIRPTLTVGAASGSLFAPVEHAERMLSLDNVFSDEEFLAWAAKVERDAGRPVHYLCELKIDGLALVAALRARPARLGRHPRRRPGGRGRHRERAAGRAASRIASPATGHPALVEVRGEVFFNVADFESLNAYQEPMGDRLFANPAQRGERVAAAEDRGQERAAARRDAPAAVAAAA